MTRPALLLVLLAACSNPDPQPAAPSTVQPPPPRTDHLQDHGCEASGHQGAAIPFWVDADGDGFGAEDGGFTACSQPPGTSHVGGDCDDAVASTHPDASERCNGRDDDCDGTVDEDDAVDAVPWVMDADGDGQCAPGTERLACQGGPGWVPAGAPEDCDDSDPDVRRGAPERCNGIDDDCDGTVDEDDAIDVVSWYRDADGDGFGAPHATQVGCAAPEGWVEPGPHADCDDGDPGVNPDADELCNGIDDDCDEMVDEDDAVDAVPWYADTDGDRFGDPGVSVLSCRPPQGYVSSPGDCDDLRASSHLGATELCNGLDDDCDGTVDEDDAIDADTWFADRDGDRFGDPDNPRQACRLPRGYSATAGDCDDTRRSVHPESVEVCNGHDDDCDGAVDEPDADDAFTWYPDADLDGWGDATQPMDACYQPTGYVSTRGDCDDADATVRPDAGETHDGKDNDCNGDIDDLTPGG